MIGYFCGLFGVGSLFEGENIWEKFYVGLLGLYYLIIEMIKLIVVMKKIRMFDV